ncbi:hypothetical protein VNO78_09663 [Psophocarpus tetragonolobus]|uniref:HpcH/HpaI aldolase/citrate lyase domain-containing protein n=1 Tax=Psophocarpus tetragonolobus TaxID=3891 RepID=A0AAN9XTP1_PSOTE
MGSISISTSSIRAPLTRTGRRTITPYFSNLLLKPKSHSLRFSSSKPYPSFPLSKPLTISTVPKSTPIPSGPPSHLNLKSRLRNGETLYGLFLLSFSPTLAEIAGLAGYDFVVVDMEHGPGGIHHALPCLHALAAANTAAILRVPESSAAWAKKALDLGPQGLMFPMIDSAESAQNAVSYCRFPPSGLRGAAHPIVRASKYGIDEGYLGNYLDELLVMCQVESEEGVGNAGEIAAVDGVDCVQMGPLDLSASLGYLWDPGNKRVKEVLREAENKVLESRNDDVEAGAFLAGFATLYDAPGDMKSRGYHMVSGAVDVGLFRSAAVEDVLRFKIDASHADEADDKEGDEKYWMGADEFSIFLGGEFDIDDEILLSYRVWLALLCLPHFSAILVTATEITSSKLKPWIKVREVALTDLDVSIGVLVRVNKMKAKFHKLKERDNCYFHVKFSPLVMKRVTRQKKNNYEK